MHVGARLDPANLEIVAPRTDIFELGRLGLDPGEARSLEVEVALEPVELGGERYEPEARAVPARLDVARTTSGYALRLRFEAALSGPCARCLEDARAPLAVDASEIDQPRGGEELRSPYLRDDEVDLKAWARDALLLSLPVRILCRDDCLGLCPQCGVDLNRSGPGHEHEKPRDPRWSKLSDLKLE